MKKIVQDSVTDGIDPEGRYDFQGLKALALFAESHEHFSVDVFSKFAFDF